MGDEKSNLPKLCDEDRASDPFAAIKFQVKSMFKKPGDPFLELQAQLIRIEGTLQAMTETEAQHIAGIAAVQSIVMTIAEKIASLDARMAALEAKIGASVQTTTEISPYVDALQNIAQTLKGASNPVHALSVKGSAIKIIPSVVNITGGPNSKASITVSDIANPSAIFSAVSSNAGIVTVSPNLATGSFLLTEVREGSAAITIKDNANPPNTASVNVTAT
jgi:hypothetical protein